MPFITRPRWLLTVDGVELDAGDVNLSFALGPIVTTIADIEIVTPAIVSPAVRAPVTLRYVDRDTMQSWPVFAGFVDEPLGVSHPNRLAVRCHGPLSLLRDTWDADTDFTGDQERSVVTTALTQAGIAYTLANLQAVDLVLGPLVDVIAPKRQKRSAIVADLNDLLAMNLIEIGGEPHRFYVDRVPAAADIVRTFAAGVDADFWSNERRRGRLDEIRNYWKITGTTYPCGTPTGDPPKPPCRCTIWADAAGANPALGAGVRTEPAPVSSDLIQDQDFAEWVATENIRVSNRVPDFLTMATAFDPEIHVGQVIGVRDPSRGVDLSGDADAAPYLIERIEVQGFRATYELRGASTGTSSAITSGVEKRCNQTTKPGPPVTPGFVGPTAWPPIFVTPGPWNPCDPPGEITCPGDLVDTPFAAGIAITSFTNWKIAGTVTLTDDTQRLTIGVDTAAGAHTLTLAGAAFYTALLLDPQLYEVTAPAAYRHVEQTAPLNVPLDYSLQWDEAANTLEFFLQINDESCYGETITFADTTMTFVETIATVTGAPTRAGETLTTCADGGPVLVPISWTVEGGNWAITGADADNLLGPDLGDPPIGFDYFGGTIYHADVAVDGVGWTMSGELTLGDRCSVDIRIEETVDFDGWSFGVGTETFGCSQWGLQVGSPDDGGLSADLFCWTPDVPLTFTATRDDVAETFSVTVTQGAETRTVSVASTTAPVDNWRIAVYLGQEVSAPSTSLHGLELRDFTFAIDE